MEKGGAQCDRVRQKQCAGSAQRLGGSGGMPPQEIESFRRSEIDSGVRFGTLFHGDRLITSWSSPPFHTARGCRRALEVPNRF